MRRRVLVGAVVAAALAAAVFVVLSIPRALSAEEVGGRWSAIDGGTGSAVLAADGTFTMTGLSLNPFTGREPRGDFAGSGRWSLLGAEGRRIVFEFTSFAETAGEPVAEPFGRSIVRDLRDADGGLVVTFSDGEEQRSVTLRRVSG